MPALTLANLYYNSQRIARCYYEHESSTHHINTLPRILFRHPTEGPSTALTLILRLLVVSINLSMNCKSNQVVRTANNGYSNRLITLQGCTSSHMFSPLSVCTRHVLGRLQAKAERGCRPRPNQPLKSLVQVYRLFGFHPWGDPAGVSLTAPNDVYRVPESPNGQPVHRATYLSHHSPPRGSALRTTSSKL